ncbi:hypothetical protein GA0070215_1563 [Micromonospora marina]|uniref:Uncharacterized protein n=1 Tax=Micromonospora marina TaxID=307120 RepID=A0A1C5ANN4_9ACTN|nr:hypothetical protein GA0070215_1563 [Micromonospora marina]
MACSVPDLASAAPPVSYKYEVSDYCEEQGDAQTEQPECKDKVILLVMTDPYSVAATSKHQYDAGGKDANWLQFHSRVW